MDLGANLRRLRERHGITQHGLARKSGISRETIAKIETGERASIKVITAECLTQALGEPLIALLGEFKAGR